MISSINFDLAPLLPGEIRPISIDGSTPIRVQVHCFTFRPPPPDYKPCRACGVLKLQSGQVHMITADRDTFAAHGGELHLDIEDADGDMRELRIGVEALATESGSQMNSTV